MYCYLTFLGFLLYPFFLTILFFSCVVLVLSSLYAFFGMFSAAAFCFYIAYLVLFAFRFVSFAYVFLFLFSLVAFF
jgi:hypothetical protein